MPMMKSGSAMYQYLDRNDSGVVASGCPSCVAPGTACAPCERGKNVKPICGLVCGNTTGMVMAGVAVS